VSMVLVLVFVLVNRLMWTISPNLAKVSWTTEDIQSNGSAQMWCFNEKMPTPRPIYVFVQLVFTARNSVTFFCTYRGEILISIVFWDNFTFCSLVWIDNSVLSVLMNKRTTKCCGILPIITIEYF